jgi:putative copper export protein
MLAAGIGIAAVAISVYPTLQFATWFADYLDYDMLEPLGGGNNGWAWMVGFFIMGIMNIAVGYLLVLFLLCKRNKWNLDQAKNYFIKSKYPRHWYKEV